MTPQEMIDIITAFKNGEQIEFKEKITNSIWIEVTNPVWNFDRCNYRIKSKMKELYQYLLYNLKMKTYISSESFYENSFDLQSELTSNYKIIQRLNHTKVIIKEE